MPHLCRVLVGSAVAGVLAATVAAMAETITERAKRDAIVRIERGDPAMAAAFRKARETLPEFLKLMRISNPSISAPAVKVAVIEGDENEFFWISPFEENKGAFTGRINNTPRSVKNVKFGQIIKFTEGEIVDWFYLIDGKMKGNFTACAMLKREPPDQAQAFMKQYGLSCEP